MPEPVAAEMPIRSEARAEREAFSASPKLRMHIAQGVFEGNPSTTVPDKVAAASYQALEAQHNKLRGEDNERIQKKLLQDLSNNSNRVEDIRIVLSKKKKVLKEEITEDQIVHHEHMVHWAIIEGTKANILLQQEGTNNSLVKEAFSNLNIDTSSGTTIVNSLFNAETADPGQFYTNFCTGDTNAKLANALTVEQMQAIKPFLKDLLGDPTDTAFNALVALKQTQEALKDDSQKQAMGSAVSNPLPPTEHDVLIFYKNGLTMVPKDQLVKPQESAPQSSTTQPKVANTEHTSQEDLTIEQKKQLVAKVKPILQDLSAKKIEQLIGRDDPIAHAEGVFLTPEQLAILKTFVVDGLRTIEATPELRALQKLQESLSPQERGTIGAISNGGVKEDPTITEPKRIIGDPRYYFAVPPATYRLWHIFFDAVTETHGIAESIQRNWKGHSAQHVANSYLPLLQFYKSTLPNSDE